MAYKHYQMHVIRWHGEWRNEKKHGRGKQSLPDGTVVHDGEWNDLGMMTRWCRRHYPLHFLLRAIALGQ